MRKYLRMDEQVIEEAITAPSRHKTLNLITQTDTIHTGALGTIDDRIKPESMIGMFQNQ